MNQVFKSSAQKVQEALSQKGLECQVLEVPQTTRTAEDAAAALGCNVAQIVKSLIFKTKETHKPVLILVSGPNRVSEKTIETYVGEKITKADADFVRDATGFAIGGIPPVGHKAQIDFIFIDEDLMKLESLWAAAGTPNAVFELKVKELVEVTGGRVVSVGK